VVNEFRSIDVEGDGLARLADTDGRPVPSRDGERVG
jgi:hypothetical protein